MTNRLSTASLVARSAAAARPAPLTLLAIALTLMAVAAALFILYAHPAHAEEGSAPDKPRGLDATAAHDSITLTWDDPDDDSITGYVILRRIPGVDPEGQFDELVADTGTAAATYTDASVAAETRYTYRIKAINQYGASERSRWVHINTPAAPDPEIDPADLAPTSLAAALAGGQVVLSWDPPAEDAGSVTGYEILRGEGEDEPATLAADTGSAATTYTDATATKASASYAYSVKAIRDGERSQASNETVVQLPPAVPTGVLSAAVHDRVMLSWNDPQDDTITGYRILRREPAADDPGEFAVLTENTGSATTSYTDTDVAPSTSYAYRVQAISPHGVSGPSRDVLVDTPAVPEPLRTLPAETKQLDGTSDEATVSEPEDEDFPSSTATRGYVAIGESATGEIGRPGDWDAFRVELESSVTYQIDVKGDATADGTLIDPYLRRLKDADGNNVPGTSNDNANDMLNSQLLFTPGQSGSYYIQIRSATQEGYAATGTYTVSVKLEGAAEEEQTDLLAADASTILLLGVGDEITQTIDYFADEDWIKVILTAGTSYSFTVTGGWADDSLTLEIPQVGLFDSASQPLLMYRGDRQATAWTQFEGVDGVATGYHKAEKDGTYYVSVSSRSDVGTYRVSVQEVPESAYHSGAGVGQPHGPEAHYHPPGVVWVREFLAWCPRDMEQGTVGGIPVEGGTHRTRTVQNTQYGLMPDESSVRLDMLARCVGVGEWGNNDNRRWYRLFDHGSASNDVPHLGALSNANPKITRHDYLGVSREQDWTRFSVDPAGTFCVSVNRPAVTVRGNNGGDAQSIPNATRVYRERVSKTSMSLDFANDPAGAKAAWLANSEIVRVELPPGSSPTAFFSDGTDLPLEDTWHLYDGTIDGDNYGGFVGDQRRVVHHATYKEMTDRQFQSQRYVQIDGAGSHEYFATVVHGGTGSSGNGKYVLTISLDKCLPHSMMENGNGRSVPPPQNLRAVQEKGTVELAWDAPDDAGVTGYRIERRPAGGNHGAQQRSVGKPRDHHTLVEDTGNTETGYTDESAEQGVEYEYRVSSRNEDGPGEASEWVGPKPADDAASEATDRPHGLSAVAENGHVTLTWNAPDHADSVFNYRVLRHRPEQGEPEPLVYVDYTGSLDTTYTDTAVDSGVLYVYRVQAADLFGFLEEASEAASVRTPESTANVPAAGASTITGTVRVGEVLEVDTSGIEDADGLDNADFTYQWLANDSDISGATNATYTLVAADEGKAIKVEVSFTDDAGNGETLTSAATDAVAATPTPNSPATGVPTISGTAQVGETLTADTSGIADEDGLENITFTYQWLADDAEIAGATGSTYTLADADEDKAIRVRVSFTDNADNEETLTSEATDAVAAAATPNSPATGAPTISGTAQVGEVLEADTSGIADADGLTNVSFTYQWLADDADISGATGSTYTLADAEEGKAIKVEVTFTDDAGNDESLTSAATDAVAAAPTPNSPATGAPTISGTAQVGETLTADTSGIADSDGLNNVQYEYQWLADAADISGATNATYTLADTDEGKAIKVEVTFTDDADNEESLTSAATDAVVAAEPTEPPDKPKGLDATATHDSVTLTWDDPEDDSITGYVILRRVRENDQGGDFSVLVANTGSAATTYTDNEVAASTTYTYRIKAINEHGVSERSRWVHIDTPAPPVPDKPTGLEATASHGQVVLTWDDPEDESITGYVILRRIPGVDPEGQFDELVANTGTAATTYTDDTVAAETRYTYRIKAINEYGVSERSRWFHIDTPAAP